MTFYVAAFHISRTGYGQRYTDALRDLPVEWNFKVIPGLSASYSERRGLASRFPTLESYLASVFPTWRNEAPGPVVLMSWSAGTWAIRYWLRKKKARDLCTAVVLLDGLHAGGNEDDPADLLYEGVYQYAREAIRDPARKLLIATNSDIRPSYSSTSAVARELLDRLGIVNKPDRQKPDEGEVPGVSILDYGGHTKQSHMDHVRDIGPALLKTKIAPHLFGYLQAKTDPAPPLPTESLSERALAVALAEAETWTSHRVSSDRVAAYFAGCQRHGLNIGDWLADQVRKGVKHAFCAAAVGWCERVAAVPGEAGPVWRAGAREIERDALSGRRGRWVSAADLKRGERPPAGSVVVYWRGNPASGFGHVERLVEAGPEGFKAVGANEAGGRWYIDAVPVPYDHPRLLGMVVDDDPIPEPRPVSPESTEPEFIEDAPTDDDWRELRANWIPLELDLDEMRRNRDRSMKKDDDE